MRQKHGLFGILGSKALKAAEKRLEAELEDAKRNLADCLKDQNPSKTKLQSEIDSFISEFDDPSQARPIIEELFKIENLVNSDRQFDPAKLMRRQDRVEKKFIEATTSWKHADFNLSRPEQYAAVSQRVVKIFSDWFCSEG
ncbi:MAG: hypothetical protein ACJ763_09250 [Bdellovibrionia bacterium]